MVCFLIDVSPINAPADKSSANTRKSLKIKYHTIPVMLLLTVTHVQIVLCDEKIAKAISALSFGIKDNVEIASRLT